VESQAKGIGRRISEVFTYPAGASTGAGTRITRHFGVFQDSPAMGAAISFGKNELRTPRD
jgi:hypothetical protein